ncbi:hypothetical protein [Lysinibacillus odysseyi]|uniref:Uncharacterized protein n=1 Tax=Lysinibacillus odysseyi 34hs-1 = NBRC 100172 TaxID=1220589 RepID=A0A0A3IF22_9BACI|nr:hypothetical protein [Lysinibacillus odysseyi]KGR83284.1 hypothetical protein CD32_15680 [Lysinibacillus odysseyi 34hs-1 = NBRC 100172]
MALWLIGGSLIFLLTAAFTLLIVALFLLGDDSLLADESVVEADDVCLEGEMYNEEEQICMLEVTCESPEECAAWGDRIIMELEGIYGPLDDYTAADGELTPEEIIYTYEIEDNRVPEDVEEDYLWQWHSFDWMTPDNMTTMIDMIEIFEGSETNAYVKVAGGTSATLGLNSSPFIPSETIQNNLHELAHLLSLTPQEVDYSLDEKYCWTNYTEEGGCFYEDSYLYLFYGRFWLLDYEETGEYFLSEYAATHEQEDFAESFMYFVLYPKPEGTTVAERKILFFYQFDEMIELRAELLARIATWLVRTG